MKQKRKGQFPVWARPVIWGKVRLGTILWLNLWAGILVASIPMFLLAFKNSQAPGLNWVIAPLLFLIMIGFYLTIASAYLIFWGYAEDEETY